MIVVDMTKALKIKQDHIRAERKPLLEALDIEFVRALEAGDLTRQATIVTRKQALRDCTQDPAILNAVTPDELKAARPAALES